MNTAIPERCPKCGHPAGVEEQAAGICSGCGLVFAKWQAREHFVPPAALHRAAAEKAIHAATPAGGPTCLAWWLDAPLAVSRGFLIGRLLIWIFIALWALRLGSLDYRTDALSESFMHLILLPIHEAGHVFFIPLGQFMTVLGGSLFQVLLPLICGAVMLLRQQDRFAAGLGLWWAGASLVDLSAYIYDAADPVLPLIGGGTGADSFHDWIFLLDHFGTVARSPVYAGRVHVFGILMMVFGLTWAALVLWRQHGSRIDRSSGLDPPL
ncbi:MAG: zinc ribbon domain-containing protein [Proteobacteria bacterium]|nr:zinc ribbon domain-containing protein [Pseudomonadota bacterium]HQR03817.1 hypothetical protein [Rhodocyclaceae bacterium]